MQFTQRQKEIIHIITNKGPITSEAIAEILKISRATIRADLSVLTLSGIIYAKPNVGYFIVKENLHLMSALNVKNMLIKDIYTIPAVVGEDTSVYDAIVALFMEDVGSLFVSDKNQCLVGVISRKDMIKAIVGGGDIKNLPVGIIMTRMPNVITIKADDPVSLGAERIIHHQVDSLPVVRISEEGMKIVGKVSKTSYTKLFFDLFRE